MSQMRGAQNIYDGKEKKNDVHLYTYLCVDIYVYTYRYIYTYVYGTYIILYETRKGKNLEVIWVLHLYSYV
jgi:hypothetical protein